MKIQEGYMLREIVDTWVVVPLGERLIDFNGLLTLSESAALLWRKLEQGATEDSLLEALLQEYDIDESTGRLDIRSFLDSLTERGLLA